MRKRTTKRVKKRLAALPKLYERGEITKEQFRSSIAIYGAASTYGWLGRANTYNLRVKIQLDDLKKKVGELI